MSLQDIKRISIRSYLAHRGIRPTTEKPGYGLYLSPIREETDPSFKVDWNANLWHDFGTGEGGSIIDLVARMENCSVAEAIRRLEGEASYTKSNLHCEQVTEPAENSRIEIISVGELKHPALTGYLKERCIDLATARKHCNEVRYSTNGRQYFAIGFKNDAGGWELRNRLIKASSSPKNITTIENGSDTVMVFEGFMDFLSYLSLKNSPSPAIDTTVLNSVANLQKAVPFLESHTTVHAFLDNDESGRKAVAQMEKLLPKSELVNQSKFYRNHKDVNDYLRDKSQPQKVGEDNAAHQIKRQIPVRKKGLGPKW